MARVPKVRRGTQPEEAVPVVKVCADPLCGHPAEDHRDEDGCIGVIVHPATGPADDFDPPWSERCYCPKFWTDPPSDD